MIGKQGVSLLIGKQGVQVKTALSAASEVVAEGIYDATILSAVDADLAVGNIKVDVNIFGKVGTLEATLIDDILGEAPTAFNTTATSGGMFTQVLGGGADLTLATKTQDYAAGSRACSVAFICGETQTANTFKLRHYMAGVMVEESAYMAEAVCVMYILSYIKAMEGSQTCELTVHNYFGSDKSIKMASGFGMGEDAACGIAIGSIKT